MPIDQAKFVKVLETFGSKSIDSPIFGGKMDPNAIID